MSNPNPDVLEVAPGTQHEKLEGWIPELASDDDTITRKDGSKVEGYIFDRRTGKSLADSVVRLYPKDSSQKLAIAYSDIAALAFSGRDTAAGKSFEAWIRKYWQKKMAGEKNIALKPEALE